MNLRFEPDLRYSNFFWALPKRNVYMAVGYHCQVIMVFPALDIVAVTTTRDFYPFGVVTDYISGAVKSETALAPSPEGASLLADAVRDVSTEKPSEVGATPETAAAISGKVYTFPGNGLGLKSLTLTLTGPQPRIDLEFYDRDPDRAVTQGRRPDRTRRAVSKGRHDRPPDFRRRREAG